MTVAVIDGDIVAFRASVSAQKDIDWGDGQEGLTIDPDAARTNADNIISDWKEMAGATSVVLCFSMREKMNFRKFLNPTYKANRVHPKPEEYWSLVQYLEAHYKHYRIEGLEGDDVMGILATSDKFPQCVLVSTDKDMKTIPGMLLNPNHDDKPRRIRPSIADHWWMTQTLCGDRTDEYFGIPGIGPAKAAKIIAPGESIQVMWPKVLAAFKANGLTEKDALLQARMARILRRNDYNKEKDEITLWHPTTKQTLSLPSLPDAAAPVSSASPAPEPKAESPKRRKSSRTASGSKRSSSRARSKA